MKTVFPQTKIFGELMAPFAILQISLRSDLIEDSWVFISASVLNLLQTIYHVAFGKLSCTLVREKRR